MKHILVVDDDPCTCKLISRLLENESRRIHIARSCHEALELLRAHPCDLILTDIIMDDRSGVELLEEVRKQRLHTPVVLITGSPEVESAVQSVKLGAFDYLCKPLHKDSLLAAAESALEYKEAFDRKARETDEARRTINDLKHQVLDTTAALSDNSRRLDLEANRLKHANQALAYSRSQSRALIDATDEFAVMVDLRGNIIIANQALASYLGHGPDELVGMPITCFMDARAAASRMRMAQQVVETGKPVRFSDMSGGKSFDNAIYPVRDAGDDVAQLAVYTRDVTARVQLERELALTKERLQMAFEAANDGIWDWDISMGNIYLSPRSAQMLGYTPLPRNLDVQELLGFVHPEDVAPLIAASTALLRSAEGDQGEMKLRVLNRDGMWQWLLARGKIISRDKDGRPLRAVGTHMDITDAKRSEQRLRREKEDAESDNRAKTSFLAAMSHEFKTPIHHINSLTDLLLDDAESPGARENLSIIKRSVHRLNRLVDQALHFSRLEAGTMTFEKQPFDLAAVLRERAPEWRGKAVAKDLDFSVSADPGLPGELTGDPMALVRILDILVDNAVKFTAEGAVSLRAAMVPGAGENGDAVEIIFSCEDTGIGIDPEEQESIFTLYTQSEKVLQRRFGGAGLGLATARKLVEGQGGMLWVESAPGEGSRFLFRLPFSIAADPVAP